MLGPLPTLYRVIVSACAFLSCFGLGVWIASLVPHGALAPVGMPLGAAVGVLAALLVLNGPADHDPRGRVRVRAPRR